MNAKLARISDLMGAGWDVEDIRSDDERIEVLLARGASRATVVLDRLDALEVLGGAGPPAGGARAARGGAMALTR